MKKAKIFIISGPGGAGKTTLVNQLFQKKHIQDLSMKAITVTTRQSRPQEEEGKDYFFVTKEEFLRLKKNNFFLESQKVLDNYYGTPKLFRNLAKSKGKSLILCIDVKGGMCLKKSSKADKITTIFIAAPSEKALVSRMKKRAEGKELMKKRVSLAKEELRFADKYDFLVVNRNLKNTLEELEHIILKGTLSPKKKMKK